MDGSLSTGPSALPGKPKGHGCHMRRMRGIVNPYIVLGPYFNMVLLSRIFTKAPVDFEECTFQVQGSYKALLRPLSRVGKVCIRLIGTVFEGPSITTLDLQVPSITPLEGRYQTFKDPFEGTPVLYRAPSRPYA